MGLCKFRLTACDTLVGSRTEAFSDTAPMCQIVVLEAKEKLESMHVRV